MKRKENVKIPMENDSLLPGLPGLPDLEGLSKMPGLSGLKGLSEMSGLGGLTEELDETDDKTKKLRKPGEETDEKGEQDKSVIKIPWEILLNFLRIFKYSSCWDKCLLLIGTIFTLAHAGCFLLFLFLLGLVTEPFIVQANHGYGNRSLKHEENFFETMNGSRLLTKLELTELITEVSLCFGVIAVGILVASFFQTLCWEWAAENQCCRIKGKLAVQILRQDMQMFEQHTAGELGFKLINDVERVREGIGHKLSMILKHVTICGILISFGLQTNWELTLIFLTLAPLPALLARFMYYGRVLAQKYAKEKEMYAQANTTSIEVLSNIGAVAAFAREDREIDKYKATLSQATEYAIMTYKSHAVGIAIFFFLLYGSYAFAFQEGCKRLLEDSITSQELHRVFFGVTMTVFSVSHILPWISTISSAYGSRLVLTEVLNSFPQIDVSSEKGKIIRHLRGKLKFENVMFAYPANKEKYIINNFTVESQANQTIGIIGRDSSGKTTLVNLLLRFYDVDCGAIKIDDVDLRDLNVRWLRDHIAVVPRTPIFRQETILKNIMAGHEKVTFDEVIQAAKLAEADEFIRSLPQGYETTIGVTGAELARNEKQRISIIRALVRKPFWLVFDDALADLPDYHRIVSNIKKARRGGATIILAHRTAVVKNADVIHVLHDGKIIDTGNHEELLDRNEIYADMANQERRIPKHFYKLTEEDPDVAPRDLPVIEEPRSDGKTSSSVEYKGFWKMLKLVNRDKKDWYRWKLGGAGCVITGICNPIFALFFTDIFATFGEKEKKLKKDSEYWTSFLTIFAAVNAIGYLLRSFYLQVAGEYGILNLRLFSFMSMLRHPMEWFDQVANSPASLSSRLASEVQFIKTALDNRVGVSLSGFMAFGGGLVLSFFMCWQLALIILASVPVFALLILIQIKIQRGDQIKEMELMDYANALFTQAIQRIWTIQAFTQENEIVENYSKKIKADLKERHMHCITFAIIYAISCSIIYFLFGAIMLFGAHLIHDGVLEPEMLYRVFLVITFGLVSAGPTIAFVSDMTKAEISFARTLTMIDGEENFQERPDEAGTISPWIDGAINFENVEFGYPNRRSKVLDGIYLNIPAGKCCGLTGAFGAGKTTMLALLERFYEPTQGKITLDGDDIRTINVGHLRTNIGYVPTETIIFNGTIEENISYGYCGEVEGEGLRALVQEVVEATNLKELMERYPDGYSTKMIQGDGVGLSTIEEKKISIARALIRSPRILLIDEIMIGLNATDEEEMLNLIKKIIIGRTCVITSARIELLSLMDMVAVLQDGKIIECGTQDELMAIPNGSYASLFKTNDNVNESE